MRIIRGPLSYLKQGVLRFVTYQYAFYRENQLIHEYRQESKIILHRTPEFSGGAATSILTIIQALPDYNHVLVSDRNISKIPAYDAIKCLPNVRLLTKSPSIGELRLLKEFDYVTVMNHCFYDLIPVTKEQVQHGKVLSFVRYKGANVFISPDKVDKVILFTKHLEDEELQQKFYGPHVKTVIHMHNGIDTEKYQYQKRTTNYVDSRFVIGNVTNGAAWKYADDFVDICEGFPLPNAYFRLLGAGRLKPRLREPSRFEILQPYSISIDDYLSNISVLIHKTRDDISEIWPRAVAEAMCTGIPVVAENRGGLRDQIIHGETGFLCDTGKDFHTYLMALAQDMDLYKRISQAARRYAVEHFSLETFRKNLLAIIENQA